MSLRAIMTGFAVMELGTDDPELIAPEVKRQLTNKIKSDDLAQKSKAKHHNQKAHEPKLVQRPKNHDHSLDGASREFGGSRRRGPR